MICARLSFVFERCRFAQNTNHLRQQFCATAVSDCMENEKKWNEGDVPGQVPDKGIKTVQ